MGSKAESKKIMENAHVPVVPGYHGTKQDIPHFKEVAKKIGYPVILKASLGGGGKGMRIIDKEEDFETMYDQCQSEAFRSFKDKHLIIEKYVKKPRHIEV